MLCKCKIFKTFLWGSFHRLILLLGYREHNSHIARASSSKHVWLEITRDLNLSCLNSLGSWSPEGAYIALENYKLTWAPILQPLLVYFFFFPLCFVLSLTSPVMEVHEFLCNPILLSPFDVLGTRWKTGTTVPTLYSILNLKRIYRRYESCKVRHIYY